MSKFKKNERGTGPALNTASLPDIVFMLLFFFMVATTSKETDPAVKIKQPEGKRTIDLTAFKQRSEIDFLYIGKPRNPSRAEDFKFGFALSLDNVVQASEDELYAAQKVAEWKLSKKNKKPARMKKDIGDVITCIKADKNTPAGIIFEIRDELEKIKAWTIAYAVVDKGTKKD
ncbi:MAG: hypothetical protein FJX80_05170 [Bacteroidetes bacterium]|nr:hypothetical protein [Bacteroidota bacterium]